MRIEDISKIMENIDKRHVDEAVNYKPKNRNATRLIALAACIAIIVTSVPLALILNREDVHTHDHGTTDLITSVTDDPNVYIPVIPQDDIKGYGNLALSNGSLNLDVIQLSNGKIDEDADTTKYDKYVYEYTPVDPRIAFAKIMENALPYHGLTEINYNKDVPYMTIDTSRYYVESRGDTLVSGVYSDIPDHDAKYFVNQQLSKLEYESKAIKFPEEETSEKVFETFKTQINAINEILVNDLDTCWVMPLPYLGCSVRSVYFWNSSDECANQEFKAIEKTMKEHGLVGLSSIFENRTVKIDYTLNEAGYVEKITVDNLDSLYLIDYEKCEKEIIDYMALEIIQSNFCDSAEASFWKCATDLEQFLIDVFGIAGFENSYNLEIRDLISTDDFSKYNSYGVTKAAILEVAVNPTQNHTNDVVEFVFYSIDGETFFLYEIISKYCMGGDRYIHLIPYGVAIDNLINGYGIGNIGQDCYICREKYYNDILKYVKYNTTYELVVLPDVVFETEEGELLYDLPFYKFTTTPDENGKSYVSYVMAISKGYNIKFSVSELNKIVYEHNLSLCPNAADHRKLEREKIFRIEALKDKFVEEYLGKYPEASKSTAADLAEKKYKW